MVLQLSELSEMLTELVDFRLDGEKEVEPVITRGKWMELLPEEVFPPPLSEKLTRDVFFTRKDDEVAPLKFGGTLLLCVGEVLGGPRTASSEKLTLCEDFLKEERDIEDFLDGVDLAKG